MRGKLRVIGNESSIMKSVKFLCHFFFVGFSLLCVLKVIAIV